MFANPLKRFRERRREQERKVMRVLHSPDRPSARCIAPQRRRSVDRLWLDDYNLTSVNVHRVCRRLAKRGLVQMEFRNPYIIGRGSYFVGLTQVGAEQVSA